MTNNYVQNRDALFKTISNTNAKTKTFIEGKIPKGEARHLKLTLNVDETGLQILKNTVEKFGYITEQTDKTIDNSDVIQKLSSKKAFLRKQLDAYNKELQAAEHSSASGNREILWEKIRSLENEIYDIGASIDEKLKEVKYNVYEIELTEEINTPQNTSHDGVQFVNMPGLAYSRLRVENPLNDFSADYYSGYELKYMFTQGKSYVQFGVLKGSAGQNSPNFINELFTYGFGQDFYPRYLGRGQRRYFNLYTGYTLGGFFASTQVKNFHKFYMMANIGLELVKTHYVLLDSRMCYFIPFYENHNLRGILTNISFNFVF